MNSFDLQIGKGELTESGSTVAFRYNDACHGIGQYYIGAKL